MAMIVSAGPAKKDTTIRRGGASECMGSGSNNDHRTKATSAMSIQKARKTVVDTIFEKKVFIATHQMKKAHHNPWAGFEPRTNAIFMLPQTGRPASKSGPSGSPAWLACSGSTKESGALEMCCDERSTRLR
jgi:hypothetical protein